MSGAEQVIAPPSHDAAPLADAIIRLSQQLYDLPNAAEKAKFVAYALPACSDATAAAVVIRHVAGWQAYFSPTVPPGLGTDAPPLFDQSWIDANAIAMTAGAVTPELAAALGSLPERCAVVPLGAGSTEFGALVLAFATEVHRPTVAAAQLVARQLGDACAQEERLAQLRDQAPRDRQQQQDDHHAQQLEGLVEISGLARQGAPPAEFASALAERVARLLHADSCVVSQWDDVSGAFRPLGGFGRVPQATPIGSALPNETSRLTDQIFTVHPVLIHPTSPDPAVRRLAEIVEERLGFRTALGVRMVADGRTVGALVVLRRDPAALFDDASSRLLEIIAAQAAHEVRSFQEKRELQARMTTLQGLWELAQFGRRAVSSRALYDDLTAHVARLLNADACFLLRYDPETKALRALAGFGVRPGQQPTARTFDAGPGSEFEAALSGQAVQIHAGADDPRLRAIAAGNLEMGFSVALAIGLVADGKTVGSLGVARNDPTRAFTAEEMRLLEIIAQPLAQEIESYRLRQELRRVLEVRDTILKHLPDAIVVYDKTERVVYANPVAVRESAGLLAEGKYLREIKEVFRSRAITVGPNDGDTWMVEQTLNEGLTVLHEQFPVLRPGHPPRYIDFSSVPLHDVAGGIQGAVMVYRDITEQVEAERRGENLLIELEASEGRFRSIVNHVDSAVMVRDRTHVLYTNQRYRELFGLEQDPVGMTVPELTDLVAPCFADSESYRKGLVWKDDTFLDTDVRTFELVAPQPRFVKRLSSPVRGGNGDYFGRVVEYRDLTREHDSVMERDAFLAHTAYVLRSGLGMPTGELGRLLRQLDALRAALEHGTAAPEQINEVEGRVRQVNREIADVLEMIARLRDLPRALEGRLDIIAAPHDLVATLDAALQDVPDLTPARVGRAAVADGPLLVQGSPVRIQQVVRWLLENAVAYSLPPAHVEVRLARVPGGMAQLRITDRGLGLTPEEAAAVFSCYYRSPRAQERWRRGLGISLYLARIIVGQLGGTLRAESPGPGQGTTFVLELPTVPDAAVS